MSVLRALVRRAAQVPGLQSLAHWAWELRDRRRRRPHPIDQRLGLDTSGSVSGNLLAGDATAYLGCVPSALTTALRAIPNPQAASFTDLGCGKGRALAVAHAFGFTSVRGVEMSGPLVKTARRNAALLARANPAGAPITVEQGDASAPAPLPGDSIYFLYHPFGEASVKRLCATLAAQAQGARRVFVVYENPVHGAVFDAEPVFHRWFARTLPYAPEELGHGPDESEPIVIWANGAAGPAPEAADSGIVVTKQGWRAELTSDGGHGAATHP